MINEQNAIAVGDQPEKLRKQLMDALKVLDQAYASLFSKKRLDLPNKRMLSDSGRFALQWQIRPKPDQPETYENQQTNVGTVVLIELPNIWIKFEDNCPECGKYPEDDLDWLAEVLNNYDDDLTKQEEIKTHLLNMPLGIMERIEGKLIVKVELPRT